MTYIDVLFLTVVLVFFYLCFCFIINSAQNKPSSPKERKSGGYSPSGAGDYKAMLSQYKETLSQKIDSTTSSAPFIFESTPTYGGKPLQQSLKDKKEIVKRIDKYLESEEDLSHPVQESLRSIQEELKSDLDIDFASWNSVTNTFDDSMKWCPGMSTIEEMTSQQAFSTFQKCYDIYSKEIELKRDLLNQKTDVESYIKGLEDLEEEMISFLEQIREPSEDLREV